LFSAEAHRVRAAILLAMDRDDVQAARSELRTARSLIETVGPHIGLVVRTRTGTPLVDTSAVPPGGTRDGWRATDVLIGSAAVPPLTDVVAPDLRVVVVEPSAVALAAVDALGAPPACGDHGDCTGSGLGALVA
jgi:hypothetical protein